MLDIDEPADLEYFEQLADLIECDEKIEYDDLFSAVSGVSAMNMGEFAENYFEEILKFLPDNSEDIYSVFTSIQQHWMMIAENLESGEGYRQLADELDRFRSWYHDKSLALIDGKPASVCEAVFECRADKLQNTAHEYEFINAMGYEPEELTMNLGSFSKIDVVG